MNTARLRKLSPTEIIPSLLLSTQFVFPMSTTRKRLNVPNLALKRRFTPQQNKHSGNAVTTSAERTGIYPLAYSCCYDPETWYKWFG
jgi:hypothetical protein